MPKIISCLSLGFCALLSGCSSLSKFEHDASDQQAKHFAEQGNLHDEIQVLAQPLIDEGHNTGLLVAVSLPDGSRQYFGYGNAGAGNAPPNEDTLFALGSLSKGFVAALLARLVDEGLLAWDDTLESLLPEAVGFSPDARKITLLQLAMHNSGLPRQPVEFVMFQNLLRYTWNGQNLYEHLDRDYALRYLASFTVPRHIEPQYSNIGYGLIGLIVERKTGKSTEALIQEKVLGPLDLRQTSYAPEKLAGYATRAWGHVGDQPKFMARGTPIADWAFNDFLRSTAGIYSSAHDLLGFAAAHLNVCPTKLGKLLSGNLKPRMQRANEAPAIQWVVDELEGQRITHQVGMVSGYTAYLGLDVERNLAVVVLQNNFNWTDRIGHKLLHRLAAYYDAHPVTTPAASQCSYVAKVSAAGPPH